MGNLVDYAKSELEIAGYLNKEKDFYGGMTGNAVIKLVECFEKQGHSGMSASLVRNIFNKVAAYKPLTPILGTDDEWRKVGTNVFQNKRLSSLFKNEKGEAHYLDAIAWEDEHGVTFTGTVNSKLKGSITSRQFVKFPFIPKTFYVKVKDDIILNEEELNKALDYYEKV